MRNWFAGYGRIFARYTDYRGRSPRSELWNFVINTILVELVICLFEGRGIVLLIFHVVAMIVLAALCVRRFHDIGRSGWYLIAVIVPGINLIAFFVLLFFKSRPETNSYGAPPA